MDYLKDLEDYVKQTENEIKDLVGQLENEIAKKSHKILVEKLAFLFHMYDMLGTDILGKAVEKWNKESIKDTPYGKRLFDLAERFSRIKLRED